jgi:lysozyme
MQLTPRVIAYLASEEAVCQEAYLDSGNVWTWALGVTNASGHQVFPRYKDNPQDLQKCFDVSVWLIREKYLPVVLNAGKELTEPQLAAALSFQWNSGKYAKYADDFSRSVEVRNRGILDKRRLREQNLYYKGEWPSLRCPLYPVSKSYKPVWNKGTLIDPIPYIIKALGN